MNKRTFVGVMIVALAVVVMAGGLLASNMGFKLNYQLLQADGGVTSKSGTNTIALPDFRQSGMATGKNLIDDIGFAQTQNVQKFLKATDGTQVYTGRGTSVDFGLNSGEGYLVKMKTTVNYIIVGADDPTLPTTLSQADGGVTSKSGTNLFAYNYHQTASTGKQLIDDIGFAQTQNVQKFLKATDGTQVYTGRGTSIDFALTPGEAYYVKMKTTVNYTPSHY